MDEGGQDSGGKEEDQVGRWRADNCEHGYACGTTESRASYGKDHGLTSDEDNDQTTGRSERSPSSKVFPS
ncbi:hypothetical protein GCM10023171_09520 [Microbacterium panaciterrae]|uniref:Uncharacterized protein n=1 Tax=Microbacterium panaciterrae TaxID=985759 RepID=A0ABP8P3D8_9MICO